MIPGYLIHQILPPHALHLSNLEWGSHFTISEKEKGREKKETIERRDPLVLIFFPHSTIAQWHSSLVMHHCPRGICQLQVRNPTLNICSRKLTFKVSLKILIVMQPLLYSFSPYCGFLFINIDLFFLKLEIKVSLFSKYQYTVILSQKSEFAAKIVLIHS